MGNEVSTIYVAFNKKPKRFAQNVRKHLSERRLVEDEETTIQKLQQVINIDVQNHYNLALCGPSGSGKSSLINLLRDVKEQDPTAAKVGFSETTRSRQRYDFPEMERLKLWDVPGSNTMLNPDESYFDNQALFAFDLLLIVYYSRLMEGPVNLAKMCYKKGLKFAIIRNKVDCDFESLRQQPSLRDKADEELRRRMRRSFDEEIEKNLPPEIRVDVKVFYVSSFGQSEFDEERLAKFLVACAEYRSREEHSLSKKKRGMFARRRTLSE